MASLAFSDQDILDVLKSRLSLLYTQNQDLNQKAQLYITLMTAALGLAGAFDVFKRTHDTFETILLIVVVLAYGIGGFIALRALSDSRWRHPVDINDFKSRRDQNATAFTDEQYFTFIFSTYTDTANFNQIIIEKKANRVRWASWLTVVVFVVTLIVVAK